MEHRHSDADHVHRTIDAETLSLSPGDRAGLYAGRALLRLGRFTRHIQPVWRQRRALREAHAVYFDVHPHSNRCLQVCHVPRHPNGDGRKVVILAHGLGERMELMATPALDLARRGHDVLLFDLRAHGRSAGDTSTMGYREAADFGHVIDVAEARGMADGAVLTMGLSTGAVAALRHAVDDPRVKAVIAVAPFASLQEAVEYFLRRFAPRVSHAALRKGVDLACREAGFAPHHADARSAVRNLAKPVLFVCGDDQGQLRLTDQVHALFEGKRRGVRALHEVDANHFQLVRSNWKAMRSAVHAFIDEHG